MKSPQIGITLIEIVVYIGLLTLVSTLLLSFLVNIMRTNARSQLTTQTVDSARSAITSLTRAIRQANGVYQPTSIFGSHPGQLSLATTDDLPTDEKITYIDFYLDNGRLYQKQEGTAAELVVSPQFMVTNLVFTEIDTSAVPSVKIQLTIAPADAAPQTIQQNSITVSTTASLRMF